MIMMIIIIIIIKVMYYKLISFFSYYISGNYFDSALIWQIVYSKLITNYYYFK